MSENNAMVTFGDYIADKTQPTLKAIADIFEVPSQRIYSVAKQPIAGQVYDAHVYNWTAISKFIDKRIGKDGDKFASIEEVYNAAMARDEELASMDKRKGPRAGAKEKALIDLGNGKTMPARRKELAVGDTVYLKKYNETFKVVYLTSTHVCLQVEGKETLNCLSNWTFNQGVTDKAPEVVEAEPVDAEPIAE